LLVVTHDAAEADHRRAIEAIGGLDEVKQVAATIRVIGPDV
jgi:hypothetical protein